MAKKPSKSETLTIRLDQKSRFMVDFVARVRGQSITTVIERAISSAADQAVFDTGNGDVEWRDIWSVIEGERGLLMAHYKALHPTFDEEKRLRFTQRFWPFFYHAPRNWRSFNETFLEVLWPSIDEIIEHHERYVSINANAAPDLMREILEKAQLSPPVWPPKVDEDEPF